MRSPRKTPRLLWPPGLLHETRLALAVRQMDELLGQLAGRVQLGLDQVKALQALERSEVLRRLAQLLAEVVGPAVDLTHLSRALATMSSSPRLSCNVSSRCAARGSPAGSPATPALWCRAASASDRHGAARHSPPSAANSARPADLAPSLGGRRAGPRSPARAPYPASSRAPMRWCSCIRRGPQRLVQHLLIQRMLKPIRPPRVPSGQTVTPMSSRKWRCAATASHCASTASTGPWTGATAATANASPTTLAASSTRRASGGRASMRRSSNALQPPGRPPPRLGLLPQRPLPPPAAPPPAAPDAPRCSP